jgi:integrase
LHGDLRRGCVNLAQIIRRQIDGRSEKVDFKNLRRAPYRRLSLPTFLLKELKAWRLACPNGPYDLVFPNLDGQPVSYSNLMQRGFRPALRRAGIRRIRFHDLRHTFASLMISNGEDMAHVSRLMGHANASFTLNVYSHMIPREHDPSGDRLASLVFGNKMETAGDLEIPLELPEVENLSQLAG